MSPADIIDAIVQLRMAVQNGYVDPKVAEHDIRDLRLQLTY